MTPGQIMFYSGTALFVLTVVLAIVYKPRKPRYTPDTYIGGGGDTTEHLRNSYPTERLTKRYFSNKKEASTPGGNVSQEDKAELILQGTEKLDETELL